MKKQSIWQDQLNYIGLNYIPAIFIHHFPTLEEASKHVYSANEKAARAQNKDRFIIGGIQTVAKKLRHIAKEAMVDEVMIMEFYSDKKASHNAYRLLTKEFNLKG